MLTQQAHLRPCPSAGLVSSQPLVCAGTVLFLYGGQCCAGHVTKTCSKMTHRGSALHADPGLCVLLALHHLQ